MSEASAVAKPEQALTPVPKKAWGILFLTLFVTISAPLNMFKPASCAGLIMGAFGIEAGSFGWTMSIYTVMGIILAFPASGIIKKIGTKTSIWVALCFCIVGSLVGTLSTTFTVLLIGRFLEGVAMGLISVAAPMAIAVWFPKHKRGLGLGIWAPWVPIGNILAFNLATPLTNLAGGAWQAVWWFGTIWAAVALILWLLLYKAPEKPVLDPDEELPKEIGEGQKLLTKEGKSPWVSVSMWLIAISFCMFNITQNGTINTFYTTYLQSVHGYEMAGANFITSVMTILAIPGAIIGGWFGDRFGRRPAMIIGFLSVAFAFIWLFNWSAAWQMWLAVIVCGFLASFATTNIFAAPAEILGPIAAGIGMGMVACFQNVGSFIGGIALGNMYEAMGWGPASWLLAFPLLAIALICVLCAKKLR